MTPKTILDISLDKTIHLPLCDYTKGGELLRVYFATKNLHKVEEVRMISPNWIDVLPLPSGFPPAPEGGDTFLENALSKAIFYSKILKSPVVADDSGLVIEALGGFPGVFSARFMEGEDYRRKMEKVLAMMEGEENRSAKFVCVAVLADVGSGTVLSAVGEVRGEIATSIRGEKGFGYDPIFIPEGFTETFGELGEEVKSKISHRSRAFKKLFSSMGSLRIPHHLSG